MKNVSDKNLNNLLVVIVIRIQQQQNHIINKVYLLHKSYEKTIFEFPFTVIIFYYVRAKVS